MERLWDRRRGAPSAEDIKQRAEQVQAQKRSEDEDDEEFRDSPPEPTAPPLSLAELPRRIFRPTRGDTSSTYLSPLLIYLFDMYSPSADSHQGYALSRGVILSDLPLINFLLDHGADPNQREALAVQIAVNKADVSLVKLLVERKEEGGKRRRLEDRVIVTEVLVRRAMQNDRTPEGRAIIDYFVNEKGKFEYEFADARLRAKSQLHLEDGHQAPETISQASSSRITPSFVQYHHLNAMHHYARE